MEKDTYETTDEYQARVNRKSYDAKINELIKSAEKEYINNFNSVNEVKLRALDPEAEYNRITDSDELKEEIKIHIQNSTTLGRLMMLRVTAF